MKTHEYVRRVWMKASAEKVFDWHGRPGAFERLKPPWERVEVVDRTGGIRDGGRVILRIPLGPFRLRWELEHGDFEAGKQFSDEQVAGPFPFWKHTHLVVRESDRECYLEDRIEYALPVILSLLGRRRFEKNLHKLFTYRHKILVNDLEIHDRYPGSGSKKILISGASGMVGAALSAFLTTGGHTVVRLVRSEPPPDSPDVFWDPVKGVLPIKDLEGFDAVVHLAGENIGGGRWTEEKKRRIRDSRVDGTRFLCETLTCLERPPKALVSASAIGFYGSRGDEILTEDSVAGSDYLADVCREWEEATALVAKNRIRTVNLRFGVILSPQGGALARMLFPFRVGVGGRIGDGQQYMSWISLEDAVQVIHHTVMNGETSGSVNAVSPEPVTNEVFTKTLGRVLKRPTLFPVPAQGVRLAFGEMGEALLLSSARVMPTVLESGGYSFMHRNLESTLRSLLGRS